MRQGDFVFTSESVSEGHPDKVCDRSSDAVVDAFIGPPPLYLRPWALRRRLQGQDYVQKAVY